jgi:hypothetical protein
MGTPSGIPATGASAAIDQSTGGDLYDTASGYMNTNIETDTAYNQAQSASLAPIGGGSVIVHGQSGHSYAVPEAWITQLKAKLARSVAPRDILVYGSKTAQPISGNLVDSSNGGAVVGTYTGSQTDYLEYSSALANASVNATGQFNGGTHVYAKGLLTGNVPSLVDGDYTISGSLSAAAVVDVTGDVHLSQGTMDDEVEHVSMQAAEGYAFSVVKNLGDAGTLGGKFIVSLVGSTTFTYDPNTAGSIPDLTVTYTVNGYNDANVKVYTDQAVFTLPFSD